jgi:NTE family protein
MTAKAHRREPRKTVSIALQGGGSHGAFGWGVLDALLADGRLELEAISGTSAGAMNAVAVAAGLACGGPEGARSSLNRFWEGLSGNNPLVAEADEILDTCFSIYNPWAAVQEFFQAVSPYEANPLDLNPFMQTLESLIDFEALRRKKSPKLFISSTNVLTGEGRVFHRDEINAKTLMASACLPNLFQAVEIGDDAYWDGGYTANPALGPLIRETDARDIVLIRIVPLQSAQLPQTPQEIMRRMHEIVFNTSLQPALRAIEFINRMLQQERLETGPYKIHYLHNIDGTEYIGRLPAGSENDINPNFLEKLRDAGRTSARAWLSAHYDDIGARSTHDVGHDPILDGSGSMQSRDR